jgi:hypothetical protein
VQLCGETAELEAKLLGEAPGRSSSQSSCNPARKLTCTFAPLTPHKLQRVYRIRNERVREFLQRWSTYCEPDKARDDPEMEGSRA